MFGREDFEKLAPVVDAFSLMTYDYSGPGRLEKQYRDILLICAEFTPSFVTLVFFSLLKWTFAER